MSVPDPLNDLTRSSTCAVPGCTRPVVATTPTCRVHLADDLRRAGEAIPFPDPELAGVAAVVVHALQAAGVRDIADGRNGAAGRTVLDLYTFVAPEREWAMGQIALNLLGAKLADLFGGTRLEPPMRFGSWILLRLGVNAPSDAGERLRESLSLALNAVMRELLGPEDGFKVAVEYAEDADDATPR